MVLYTILLYKFHCLVSPSKSMRMNLFSYIYEAFVFLLCLFWLFFNSMVVFVLICRSFWCFGASDSLSFVSAVNIFFQYVAYLFIACFVCSVLLTFYPQILVMFRFPHLLCHLYIHIYTQSIANSALLFHGITLIYLYCAYTHIWTELESQVYVYNQFLVDTAQLFFKFTFLLVVFWELGFPISLLILNIVSILKSC